MFKKELGSILLASLNETLKKGKFSPSWSEAIITVLTKEGMDKEYCENYRPISILNCDYKIYTTILTKRFEPFMAELINEDQCGFIKGRQAQVDSAEVQKKGESAMLLSLDAEKSFDSVSWYLCFEKFGFKTDLVNVIKTLYQNKNKLLISLIGSGKIHQAGVLLITYSFCNFH